MLVASPDLTTLNSSRKLGPLGRSLGVFLSFSQEDVDSPELGTKLVSECALPYSPYTAVHTILVLSSKKEGTLAIEFSKDKVRTLGEWPSEPSKLMLPILQQNYAQMGLHFIFSASGLNLSKGYRFSHVLVSPTVYDFSSIDLLGSLFVSSVPTSFCSKRGTDKNGNPLYGVDYSQLLSEEPHAATRKP